MQNAYAIAKKYDIPLECKYIKNQSETQSYSTKFSPNAKSVVNLVQSEFREDFSYKDTLFKKLDPENNLKFTTKLISVPPIKKEKPKKPFLIKSTLSVRLKSKVKIEPPKKPLEPLEHSKPRRMAIVNDDALIRFQDFEAYFKIPRPLLDLSSKSIYQRDTQDLEYLFNYLRKFPAIDKFKDKVLEQICLLGSIFKVKEMDIIGQGSMLAENLLILFFGGVEIRVPIENIHGGIQDVQDIPVHSKLFKLDSFSSGVTPLDGSLADQRFINPSNVKRHISGGIGLSHQSTFDNLKENQYIVTKNYAAGNIFEEYNNATAVATESSILLKMDIADYQKIIKYVHDLNINQIIYYLDHIDLCKQMSMASKTLLSNICEIKKYAKDEFIDQHDQKIDKIRIIFKGKVSCFIVKDKLKIELCTLNQGDYFGEQIYFRKDNRAYFNTKCLVDTEIALVPPAELQSLVKEKLALKHSTIVANDVQLLDELVEKIKDETEWKKTKKLQISRFIKEWVGDPSIDSRNWNNKEKLEKYGQKQSKK